MKGNNVTFIVLAIIVALVAIIGGYALLSSTSSTKPVSVEKDGFTLEATYQGDNKWTYIVTGTTPTPCHTFATETTMDGDNVMVGAITTNPKKGQYCAQNIQDVRSEGEFEGSQDILIDLDVMSKDRAN